MKTIIHWNINGYYTHYEQFQILINNFSPDIICLQETNFEKIHQSTLKHFNIFVRNRVNENHASGGVVIVISDKYDSTEIPLNSNSEAVAISISFPKRTHICNIYIPNSFALELQDLEDLIAQLPAPLILSGDFNSHHTLWGSTKTDRRGKTIENLLNNQDLILLSTGSLTYFSTRNGISNATFNLIQSTDSSTPKMGYF